MKKAVSSLLVFSTLLSFVLGSGFVYLTGNKDPHSAAEESEIVARINGANAYNYDLKLEEIALNLTSKKQPKGTKISVNLTEMGFDKLLGEGKITLPISVRVSSCSQSAARKIKEAGGEILTTEPAEA